MKISLLLSFVVASLMAWASPVQADPFVAYNTVTYYHNDVTGSPVVATNQQAQVVWRKTYTPYGESTGKDSDNRKGFTGHVEDANGLVYAGARYYDPALGRFLSTDPVGFSESNLMSFNRYAYANNNPYKYVDPDGNIPIPIIIVGIVKAVDFGLAAYDVYSAAQEGGVSAAAISVAENMGTSVIPGGKVLSKVAKGGKNFAGKQSREQRLRDLVNDDKVSSADRGWIQQELNEVAAGKKSHIRNPPGKDLAHERGRENAKGYGYEHANLQNRADHRAQHKLDDWGRANKERPPE